MFKGKYGELVPHQTMIQDEYRTNSYLQAIDKAVSPGDIVIDFGSGTGILAMAAAQVAGRVFAIERNPETAKMLITNIERNEFSNITVYVGSAKDFMNDYPELKADLVVSECIGDHIFENSMVVDFLRLVKQTEAPKQVPSHFMLYHHSEYISRKQTLFDKQKDMFESREIYLDLLNEEFLPNTFLDVAYFQNGDDYRDYYFNYVPGDKVLLMDFAEESDLKDIMDIRMPYVSQPGDYIMLYFIVNLYEDVWFDNLPSRPPTDNHSYFQRLINVSEYRQKSFKMKIDYDYDDIGNEDSPNPNIFLE
tara:strand:- start:2957 stop:3874 length:918 start_codon:yes stop_codon:yes gene_type:complete